MFIEYKVVDKFHSTTNTYKFARTKPKLSFTVPTSYLLVKPLVLVQ